MEGGTPSTSSPTGPSPRSSRPGAAGGKDVGLWGGGQTVQQYLAAGPVDQLELHVAPVLLGDGARIFDVGNAGVRLKQIRAVEAPGVTHLTYRVVECAASGRLNLPDALRGRRGPGTAG